MANAIFWHRRDLRIDDNAGLFQALTEFQEVQPIFIFDSCILEELPKSDRRVSVIYDFIEDLNKAYQKAGASLKVYHGDPVEVFQNKVLSEFPELKKVFTNEDYEPYAKNRDEKIEAILAENGIAFQAEKDQVIWAKDDILKSSDNRPYTVFTPYFRKWKERLEKDGAYSFNVSDRLNHLAKVEYKLPNIESLGFSNQDVPLPNKEVSSDILNHYEEIRDYPAKAGTSRLSVHLRFGTISIRKLVQQAQEEGAEIFLSELAWRDFYQQILHHFPHVVNGSFRPQYDQIPWSNNEDYFKAWCEGKTGVPIVDAGMRELNETGYMHNRVRMIVASFLTKNLLIDWRWGEAYFAEKLLDFDLAANNGGWQWAAGSGTDAAPYFRVFNPLTQAEKFDPRGTYIRKWVKDMGKDSYPKKPIVDIKESRKKAIEVYKKALSGE
ncbi:cryptochrome/photolyase family protein [Luteibaculum oceani]|uniref:Deoxyribodipyrimidine photo-lyase n=1 Tax=Luteibaculum oceani TaxID=1294296 RepID=A0A5C6VIG4_9FLAO|nr:deoxyribodipyrimidine photo-lyase [Luteibaculum oceani]TXC85342.1 deoxyribodipyrimidine photo-lyase [Luteibaculum oceani]